MKLHIWYNCMHMAQAFPMYRMYITCELQWNCDRSLVNHHIHEVCLCITPTRIITCNCKLYVDFNASAYISRCKHLEIYAPASRNICPHLERLTLFNHRYLHVFCNCMTMIPLWVTCGTTMELQWHCCNLHTTCNELTMTPLHFACTLQWTYNVTLVICMQIVSG